MAIASLFLMLLSGIAASRYFLKNADFLERIGITVFLGLSVVPFVNINYVFFNAKYISNSLTILNSILVIIFFSCLIFYSKGKNNFDKSTPGGVSKTAILILITGASISLFALYYHSNKEFLFSLGAYLQGADVECFFKETFRTFVDLNPQRIPTLKAYEINCAPANILFISTLLPILKFYSFKIVYVLFTFLIFIFTYLLINKLTRRKIIGLLTAIFAIFNPYMLSVEVLDRNVMALAVSVILFYLILEHKDKIFFHGLIFGILAGLGLRFLPLLFIFPIVIMYYYHKRLSVKTSLIFLSASIITFTFSLPHIFFHGLNGVGETEPSVNLIVLMFRQWLRTPFLPFPNLIFYVLNILNYFGYFSCAAICVGALYLWKVNRKIFFALAFWFCSVFFVLSFQRNWIQGTKYRIILEGFLPVFVFLAYGLEYLFSKPASILKKCALFCGCLLLLAGFVRLSAFLNFRQDTGFYKRKFIYQSESPAYYNLEKRFLLKIGVFPDYRRLCAKLDFRKKKVEEGLIFAEIFPNTGLPEFDKYKNFYSGWREYFFNNKNKEYRQYFQPNFVNIKIDFEKLVTNPDNAVERMEQADICSIDLTKKGSLSGVYYSDLSVSWQKELLPVYIALNKKEIKYLNELNIDLNTFTSFGKNEQGLDVVNSLHFKANPNFRGVGFYKGKASFALFSDNNTMVFRIPRGLKIIVRNWFINESGIPYKVDSWSIEPDSKGAYKVSFYYQEPESYL